MLVKRAESHTSGAPHQDGGPSFFPKETARRGADIFASIHAEKNLSRLQKNCEAS